MKALQSELRYLSELYGRLLGDLSRQSLDAGSVGTLSETILRNRDLLLRLEQMNSRSMQLSREWASVRERLGPDSRAEVTALAETVKGQAMQLFEICERRIRQLESGRQAFLEAMEGVRTGTRYLASIRPPKTNYPKFLDSLG